MAKKSFCTIALEFCRSVDPKCKCSKISPPSNSKDMHARRDIQEVQPQLPQSCRRISSVLTVSRVRCWSAPDKALGAGVQQGAGSWVSVLIPGRSAGGGPTTRLPHHVQRKRSWLLSTGGHVAFSPDVNCMLFEKRMTETQKMKLFSCFIVHAHFEY